MHYDEISYEDKKFKTKYLSIQNPCQTTFCPIKVPHSLYFSECILSKSTTTCIYLVFWNSMVRKCLMEKF